MPLLLYSFFTEWRIKGTKVECKLYNAAYADEYLAGIKGTKVECKFFIQSFIRNDDTELKELK